MGAEGEIGYGNLNSNKDNTSKNSIAIGVNSSGKVGKYSIYSSNYFSTGYYPGLSRGALVFNERVQREFSKFSVYGAVNYSSYNPKSMEDSFNWGASNTTTVEEGIKITIDWYLNNQDWINLIEAKKASLK